MYTEGVSAVSILKRLQIYIWIVTPPPKKIMFLLFQRMVEHKGKCYVPDSCPCMWKDWEYMSGEVIATPCYTW